MMMSFKAVSRLYVTEYDWSKLRVGHKVFTCADFYGEANTVKNGRKRLKN